MKTRLYNPLKDIRQIILNYFVINLLSRSRPDCMQEKFGLTSWRCIMSTNIQIMHHLLIRINKQI